MAKTGEEKTITKVRKSFSKDIKKNSLTPVIYEGEFSGVLITCGDLSEKTKKRLRDKIKFNPNQAVNELLELLDSQ